MALGDAAFSDGDIMRRLRQLEAELREMRSSRRLESSTIGAGGLTVKGEGGVTVENGGDLVVEDGGQFLALHPSGTAMLTMYQAENGKYEISIRRDDGSAAFQTITNAQGEQFWTLWDRDDRLLMSDDSVGGKGLARPWLPIFLYQQFPQPTGVGYAHLDASLITTEQTVWDGRAVISHPKITIDGVWGQASGSNNSSYRLEVNGETVGSWNVGTLIVAQRGPYDVSDHVGSDFAPVKLFASATGTGAVAAQVLGCYLRQS